MEVINNNNNNNNNPWGLRSSTSESSFHSCYEPSCSDDAPSTGNMAMMSSRVPSFVCLEDVMEEDYCCGMDYISSNNDTPNHDHGSNVSIIPLRSFSQLQQQPLSPQLTAARLALSSDIGVLRRPLDSVSSPSSPSSSMSSPEHQLAKVLVERDHHPNHAFPMSRSFATPRAAVGTVFRPSISMNSLSSFSSMKEFDASTHTSSSMPPCLMMESEVSKPPQDDCHHQQEPMDMDDYEPSRRPLYLEDIFDDVQVQILSFLELGDIRSVMATNSQFRKLLFTQDAQVLWKNWCRGYNWQQVVDVDSGSSSSSTMTHTTVLLVDDLSLPTAARPCSLLSSSSSATATTDLSDWHHQANLSLLLSMAQSQPTDIDQGQLSDYTTWRRNGSRRRSRPLNNVMRHRDRLHTTTAEGEDSKPLLQYKFAEVYHKKVVQFSGRVGQGDRCVRSNIPFPRPTLMKSKDAAWILPPNSLHGPNNLNNHKHHRGSGSGVNASLLDLFCRGARAVAPPRAAWRPFVAPFLSRESAAVHLTPRFISYFEVSILEPKMTADSPAGTTTTTANNSSRSSTSNDCVAVGVASDSFDWHKRMPGWDSASYGYHGDDGGIFHSSGGMLRKFGPSYGRGDVVGCGVDHVAGGIFFTLNGLFLGYGWTELPPGMLQKDLYPVVGIDTNDWIQCNYGTEPFAYDLKSMIVRHEELVHQSLAASASASSC